MKMIKITCKGAATAVLEDLYPLQGGLKTLSEQNYHKLKAAITGKHGFSFPFAVWKNRGKLYTVDGHQRLTTLLRMKEEGYRIPALPIDYIEANNIKEAKEKILLATSQYGIMNEESLVEFVKAGDLDVANLKEFVALQGIDIEAASQEKTPEAPEPQINKAAQLQKKWKTALGQIWEIGKHRLMCGDATETKSVDELMGRKKAVLLATDPPYGINYDNSQRIAKPRIANDDLTDGPTMQKFLESMIKAALKHMEKSAAFYFWHPMQTQSTYAAAAAAAGILIHRQIIWVKPAFVLGRGDYHWRHELCFYGWQQGHRPPFYGPRNQDTVWEINYDSDRNNWPHATIKPVALSERPIKNHSRPDEICYDPFIGSGSQMVAAEQFGRVCYGMEIEPSYVAVILQRMVAMGLKPRLIK